MWEDKFTEELEELYRQYNEIFPDSYPDEYDDIECDTMDYDEFVGYIKECIKQKKEMPDIVCPLDEIMEREKEALKLLNEICLQYIAIFGELPKDYRDIEGYRDLSNEKKKEIECICENPEEMKQYVKTAIKRKRKDTISDCFVFAFRELILEVTSDDNDDWCIIS